MKRWPIAFVLLLAGLVAGGVTGHSLLKGQSPVATPIPKEMTSYRDVVKKVLPAVVSIEGKSPATQVKGKESPRRVPFNNQQIPEEFRHFFNDFGQAPFGFDEDQTPQLGFGSGFLVDPHGVVLTNNHVVDGASEVVVTLQDGRKFTSKNIKTDQLTDLAIVRLDTKEDLPFLRLGDSDAMEIGDRVLAVGALFRLQRHGHRGHRQLQGPEPGHEHVRGLPADRRGHQPRQQRRAARQPAGRGHRHQLRHQEPERRLAGHRPGRLQ